MKHLKKFNESSEDNKNEEIEFIDKGDHLYFELGEESYSPTIYEFEYKYKKYVCKFNHYTRGQLHDLNDIIYKIEGSNGYFGNVRCARVMYNPYYYYRFYDFSKDVIEIIHTLPSSPYYSYYVVHSIDELDYDEILNQSKFSLNDKNLEILKKVFKNSIKQ